MIDSHADRTRERVAVVQRQARVTLIVTVVCVVAAIVAAVFEGIGSLRSGAWLALHLFFVGALLSAISGATQMLGVTWSASSAPPHALVATQRTALLVGVVALAVGREVPATWVAVTGGALVVFALVLLMVLLVGIRRSRTVDRFLPALDAYLLAVGLGVLGTVAGSVFVADPAADVVARAVTAHAITNLLGLVGIVIAATIPWFSATQSRSRMTPRATPRRIRAVVGALALTSAGAATATLAHQADLAGAFLAGYAITVASLIGLIPKLGRRQLSWAGPRLVQLLAGVAWWIAGVARLAVENFRDDGLSLSTLEVLAVGAYAQILVASLAYLGPVLRGGGHEALSRGFRVTRSWFGLIIANVAAVAALLGARTAFLGALIAWVLDLGVRAVRLLADRAPPTPGEVVAAP